MRNKDVDERIDKIREKAEQEKSFKYIFRGRKGKLALDYLKDKCFFNSTTYVKGDAHGTSYQEGMRMAFVNIENLIALPDETIEGAAENKIKTIRQSYERSNNTGGDSITVA